MAAPLVLPFEVRLKLPDRQPASYLAVFMTHLLAGCLFLHPLTELWLCGKGRSQQQRCQQVSERSRESEARPSAGNSSACVSCRRLMRRPETAAAGGPPNNASRVLCLMPPVLHSFVPCSACFSQSDRRFHVALPTAHDAALLPVRWPVTLLMSHSHCKWGAGPAVTGPRAQPALIACSHSLLSCRRPKPVRRLLGLAFVTWRHGSLQTQQGDKTTLCPHLHGVHDTTGPMLTGSPLLLVLLVELQQGGGAAKRELIAWQQ